jgi:hypothetical protein
MNKTQLHNFWTKIRGIKPWYFLAAGLISGLVAVLALRQNNLTMITLRAKVVEVDKNNGDIETALRDLREFVYAHMNTNLSSGNNSIKPPIQLKYRYDRLIATEKQRVNEANAKIYTDAQAYCEKAVPEGLSGRGRVPCIQDYVSSHGIKEQPVQNGLYKFDFVSPTWSPDLAGFALLLSIISFIAFAFLYGVDRWIKAELKD